MTDEKDENDKAARAAEIVPLRARRPCPICGQPSEREAYPFCSKRCKDVDLHRWLSGAYAIAATDGEDSETDGGLPPPTER